MFPHYSGFENNSILRRVLKIRGNGDNIKEWKLTKLPNEPEEGMVLLEVGSYENKPFVVLWRYNQEEWRETIRPLNQLSSLAKLVGNLIEKYPIWVYSEKIIKITTEETDEIPIQKKKKMAKEWGISKGYNINVNKVIDPNGKEICMGWAELFDLKKKEIMQE